MHLKNSSFSNDDENEKQNLKLYNLNNSDEETYEKVIFFRESYFSFFSKKISLHLSSAASYPRKYFPETFFVEILVSTFFFKLLTWQLLFDAESLKHFSNSKPPLDYPKTKTQQLKEELVIVVATLQAKICQVSGFEYRNNLAEARPNKPRSWCYKQIV